MEPISISDIIRDATWDQIDCTIVTGGWQSEDGVFEIEDGITLTYEEIEVPFEFTEEEKNQYQQYLFAKGCNALYTELQNNNPYLSKN